MLNRRDFVKGMVLAYIAAGYGNPLGEAASGKPVRKASNKWGYINRYGEMVIEPQFDVAFIFTEGLALVKLADKFGFIDKSGGFAIPPQFDEASHFREGLSLIKIGGRRCFINGKGETKIVVPDSVWWAKDFSGGIAYIKDDDPNKDGFIDRDGNIVIVPGLKTADDYFEEYLEELEVMDMDDDMWDYPENDIGPTSTDCIEPFFEGLASFSANGKWGYIDETGAIVISPVFSTPTRFSEGLAPVTLGENPKYL